MAQEESELVQLRAKVQVYETRFEEKDRTIRELRADVTNREAALKAQELALEVSNKVIEELKSELGGTRFLLSMMVDTGAHPSRSPGRSCRPCRWWARTTNMGTSMVRPGRWPWPSPWTRTPTTGAEHGEGPGRCVSLYRPFAGADSRGQSTPRPVWSSPGTTRTDSGAG